MPTDNCPVMVFNGPHEENKALKGLINNKIAFSVAVLL
jgi:hypothetical protein